MFPDSESALNARALLRAWWRVLNGCTPMLSIEITHECPLSCPGCYAYGEDHLAGEKTLRQLRDLRGDDLVEGVIELVRRHRPLHVSLVGGEPMVRHKELDRILPTLSAMGVFAMVVTSGVIPIPQRWMEIPRLRVAISVDGLPEDHDVRRKPATYERILKNVSGRKVNVHWVITRPMLARPSYFEQYVDFWSRQPEVDWIWVSLYSPQSGEESRERLLPEDRVRITRELPALRQRYPKLLLPEGMARSFVDPPLNPQSCLFSKMSVNYSADLQTKVEPCVFGGSPDCSQCGCSISTALHWIGNMNVVGGIKVSHFARVSMKVGEVMGKMHGDDGPPGRWRPRNQSESGGLVQIQP